MRFSIILTGCLLFSVALTAGADITAQMNLAGAVKVALRDVKTQEVTKEKQPEAVNTLRDCSSFLYTQNICQIVKTYLEESRDSL
jgi:hypothetical protein